MAIPHDNNDIFEFTPFRLEIRERRLLCDGQPVSLPPRVFDLLAVLVRNHGHLVEKQVLLKTLWPDSIVEESNLSVNVSALRRALGDLTGDSQFIETVPKRGYRFVAPVTVPFSAGADAASMDPSPVEALVVPPVASRQQRRRFQWTIPLVALLILALAGWFAWRLFFTETPTGPIESVAVLPFMPLNGALGQEYLAVGMADAVATRIARVDGLSVRPTSSVLRYDKPERDVQDIGHELLVDAVVEGRIQRMGERIRVTVQLWSVSERTQLWAETFDDRFDSVFSLQDEIAARVTKVMMAGRRGESIDAVSVRYSPDPDAYQLYLQGQYLVSKRLNAATQSAIDSFERAIQIDPNYPLPYAAVTRSYLFRAGEGLDLSLLTKAKATATRALELDEGIPESHVAVAQVMMRWEWNWAGAEREFRRALEINPNFCDAHAGLSTLYTALGRHSDAIREMEIAVRLEPDSSPLRSDLSWTNLFAGRTSAAIDHARAAVRMDPWSYSAHRQLSKALSLAGQHSEAVSEAQRTLEINGGRRRRVQVEIATAHAYAGHVKEADELLLTVLDPEWKEPEPDYEMAVLYTALGNPNQAIVSLTKAMDKRLGRVIWMRSDPEFAPLRNHPGYLSLVARLQLPD